MFAKLFALFAIVGVALATDYAWIRLTKESEGTLKSYLNCEAKMSWKSNATRLHIFKLEEFGLVELVRLTEDGIFTNSSENIVVLSGNLDRGGLFPYLRISYPDDEGVQVGKYRCDVTYVIPHRHFNLSIGSSEVLEVGVDDQLSSSMHHLDSHAKDAMNILKEINLRQMVWPTGGYSLLKPRKGCPRYDLAVWTEGTRSHITESSEGELNMNENSTMDHMPLDLFFVESGKNFANLSYCSRDPTYPGIIYWPYGTYCINRKDGLCPEGFLSGSVYFDDEDDAIKNRVDGDLPDGNYDSNTKYEYCCRNDKSAEEKIYLPIAQPFYLYRYQGTCQKVAGMRVTNDYIRIDTANYDSYGENQDNVQGSHPDATINPIRLELCYYELDY